MHPFLLPLLCFFFALSAPLASTAQENLWLEPSKANRRHSTLHKDGFASIAKKVMPSVVSIEIKGAPHRHNPEDKLHNKRSNGTGFIINTKGHVITNHHVIDDAVEITVVFRDQTRMTAVLLGTDEQSDLALLQLPPTDQGYSPIPFGNSDSIQIGQWSIAIGNPVGLSGTVTAGIISARGRMGVHPGKNFRSGGFIQTDASINKGNSGGPLLDTNGTVIAVTTAMKGKAQGIAFAIPINTVKRILPLLASGKMESAWIGVRYGEVSKEAAQRTGLQNPQGAKVIGVEADGPADKGGIKTGDIVLAVDDYALESHGDLAWLCRTARIGENTRVRIWREGKEKTITLVPIAAPAKETASLVPKDADSLEAIWGITLHEEPSGSLIIQSLTRAKAGAKAGLQEGDLLSKINRHPCDGMGSFFDTLRETTHGDLIELEVERGDKRLYIPLSLRTDTKH